MRSIKVVLLGLLFGLTVFSYAQVKPIIDRSVHFEISDSSASFGAKGGSKTFSITASDPWNIKSNNASWCTLKKEEKQLTVTAKENVEFSSRTGYFILECESKTIRVDVSQRAAELYLTLSPQDLNYEAVGGTKQVTVTTNGSWSIGTNNNSWILLSREGDLLSVSVESNSNSTGRNGAFTIKAGNIEKQINVTQKAESITLSLSSQELTFDATGGTRTIAVTTNSGWSIGTGMVSWGHLTREGNTIIVRVDQNTRTSSRTDWFEVKSGNMTKRVNVTQEAASVTLSLSSYELTFEASGGTKTLTVTTNGTWSIDTDMVSWGHLTKDGNTLRVRLDANNSSSSRTDWFTIKAGDVVKRVNVTQKGESGPNATINRLWVDHNVFNGMVKGMKIHIDLTVNGMKGRTVKYCVFFYKEDNTTKLVNAYYGHISASDRAVPSYDGSNWSDWWIFVPYNAIFSAINSNGRFSLDVEIQDANGKLLTRKENYQFYQSY